MAVMSYVPFEQFVAANRVMNRSSRVFGRYVAEQPPTGVAFSVADAFLRDIVGTGVAFSVADAVLRDLPVVGPLLSFSPTSLVFADTALGGFADAEVTISNTGDQPLVISLVSASGDFTILGLA